MAREAVFPLIELRIVAFIWLLVFGILGNEFVGPELSARGWVSESWAGIAGAAAAIIALPILAILVSGTVVTVIIIKKHLSREDAED